MYTLCQSGTAVIQLSRLLTNSTATFTTEYINFLLLLVAGAAYAALGSILWRLHVEENETEDEHDAQNCGKEKEEENAEKDEKEVKTVGKDEKDEKDENEVKNVEEKEIEKENATAKRYENAKEGRESVNVSVYVRPMERREYTIARGVLIFGVIGWGVALAPLVMLELPIVAMIGWYTPCAIYALTGIVRVWSKKRIWQTALALTGGVVGMVDFALPVLPGSCWWEETRDGWSRLLDALFYVPMVLPVLSWIDHHRSDVPRSL